MDVLAVSLASLMDLIVAFGPYIVIAYGIFATIVLVLVVSIFFTVIRGIWTGSNSDGR